MNIKNYISQNDRFAQLLGIELVEVNMGTALAVLKIEEKHLNSANIIHGGAIFTLADLAFAAASNSHGNVALAINASISFVKSTEKGDILSAKATETSKNHKLATYNVDVRNGNNDLVAQFSGMVYRKKEKLIGSN